MKTIKLSNNELESLKLLVSASNYVCSSGCIVPEMQYSKVDCIDCQFKKTIDNISDKIELLIMS